MKAITLWNKFVEGIAHWWHMRQARMWSKKLIAVRADQINIALKQFNDPHQAAEVVGGLRAAEHTAMSAISFHQNKAAQIRRNRGEP